MSVQNGRAFNEWLRSQLKAKRVGSMQTRIVVTATFPDGQVATFDNDNPDGSDISFGREPGPGEDPGVCTGRVKSGSGLTSIGSSLIFKCPARITGFR